MGLKIFDSFEDKLMYPLSLKLIDSPGSIMEKPAAAIQQAFSKPSIIFICHDMSKNLESASLLKWTKFVLDSVQRYHPSFTKGRIQEKNVDEEAKHSDGLFMKNIIFDDDKKESNTFQDSLEITQ